MTIRDLIARAYRLLGIIAMGESPTAAESDAGLSALNAMCLSWFGHGIGMPLVDYRLTASVDMDDLQDVAWRFVATGVSCTITLPEEPQEGDRFAFFDAAGNLATYPVTIARNGRLIEGAAANLTLNTNSLARSWFYRADAGWTREKELTLNDDPLLPSEFHSGMGAMLALSMADEFGVEVRPATLKLAQETEARIAQRYGWKGQVRADDGLLNLPSQLYARGSWEL